VPNYDGLQAEPFLPSMQCAHRPDYRTAAGQYGADKLAMVTEYLKPALPSNLLPYNHSNGLLDLPRWRRKLSGTDRGQFTSRTQPTLGSRDPTRPDQRRGLTAPGALCVVGVNPSRWV